MYRAPGKGFDRLPRDGGFRFVTIRRVSESTKLLLLPVEHPLESALAVVFGLSKFAFEGMLISELRS